MTQLRNNLIEELPDITKVTFKNVHPNYLKVIIINTFLIFTLILTGLIIFINLKLGELIHGYVWIVYLGYGLCLLTVVTFLVIGFSRRKYAMREKDITYKSGVLFKKMTTVPFSRIQHVEIDQGPVSRLFSLASLSVFTAGDSSDDLEVRGIQKEEALRIKEFISSQINE